jgi:hypothetical protein
VLLAGGSAVCRYKLQCGLLVRIMPASNAANVGSTGVCGAVQQVRQAVVLCVMRGDSTVLNNADKVGTCGSSHHSRRHEQPQLNPWSLSFLSDMPIKAYQHEGRLAVTAVVHHTSIHYSNCVVVLCIHRRGPLSPAYHSISTWGEAWVHSNMRCGEVQMDLPASHGAMQSSLPILIHCGGPVKRCPSGVCVVQRRTV